MHTTPRSWALLLSFTAALAFSSLAASQSPQLFRCQLKVLDANGQPLRDVTVETYRGPDWRGLGGPMRLESRVTTDAQGAVSFTSTNRGHATLVARKPGLSLGWNAWYPSWPGGGMEECTLEITLTAPTALAGTVQDEAGKPIADALVWVKRAYQPGSRNSSRSSLGVMSSQLGRQLLSARSGADGKFRIEGLPADATLSVTATKAGLAAQEMASPAYFANALSYQAGQTDAVVVLGPAGSVAGQVVREDTGAPLAGARVYLGEFGWYDEVEPGTADDQGRFRLSDLLPGDYKLHAVIGTNELSDWVCEVVPATVQAGNTTRNITLTASRGAVLKATLRDQSTGKPVRNGSVWLSRDNLNSQGLVSDPGLAWMRVTPGDYRFGVMAEGYNRYETQVTLERGQTNELVAELEPAARLAGTVLDPAGKPAAKVGVFSMPGSLQGGERQTDAQGHFTVYMEAGSFGGMHSSPQLLIARDPGQELAATAEVDPDATNATLKLEPALTLAARVVDPAGKPITNAEAQVMFKTEHMSSTIDQPVRANAAGLVEVKGLPAGRPYNLIITARGFGREQREVEAPEPTQRRVELEPFQLPVANLQVAGSVVDAEEKPVPGVMVSVNGDNQPYLNGRTDAKGRFVLSHLCAGQIQLSAHLPPGNSFGSVTAEAGDTNVVIQLGASQTMSGGKLAKLAGSVVTPDGKPASQVSVLLFPRQTERQTDAQGRFKLTYDANSFGNSQPLTLIVRDPAHNLAAALDLDPDVTNATVKLEPGLTLTGRVTDSTDHPLTNAEVQLTFHSANMSSSFDKLAHTDAQGRFEFKGLPAARRYGLSVSAKGFGREDRTLEATQTDTRRLDLEPFGLPIADRVIAGVVTDADDKPVAHATLNFYGDKQTSQNGQTDAKGRFHFEHLSAGEVHLSANDLRGNSGNITAEAGDTNIVLQFGVSQSMGGARSLGRLSGTVSDPDGKPAPRVTLTLFPFNNTEKRTDAQGHFKLTYNPGEWSSSPDMPHILIARDLARNLATALDLDPEATNADLKLEPGLTVTGRVVDAQGQIISNAQVYVMFHTERMSTSVGSELHASRDGHFEIKALPPTGRYSLQVSAPGFGRENRQLERGENGTNRLELSALVLPIADQRVAGVVLDADDKPVSGAWVNLDGDKQPNTSTHTDSKGRFAFKDLVPGEVRLSANNSRGNSVQLTAEAGDTNLTLQIGLNQAFSGSGKLQRLSGAVVDSDGKPAPKVRVSLFPYEGTERQTDSEGHFKLLYSPNSWGGSQEQTHVLIARDLARNLATALDVDPDATNANLKLEKGFTLAGRITDANGKPIPGAEVSVQFSSGRMSVGMWAKVPVNAEGRFEVQALPPGCRYYVNASAKGFGQDSQDVEPAQADVPRLELEPLQLPVADLPLAGVVVDADDKPVPGAWVNVYGHKQPSLNTQADAKGRFSFKQVCAGPIRLSANSQHGGYAQLNAEGGDTNLTVQLTGSSSMRAAVARPVSLKGKPLPALAPLGLTAADAPAGQPLLAVLIDAEQRPSRHALKLLTEQAPMLKQKKVALLIIQARAMTDDAFTAWKQEAALSIPVGRFPAEAAPTRAAWGAGSLPRLVLTDATHRVIAEGFPIEELEAKLKALEK
jgi:uncharacterized GH25 family protein